MKICIAEDDSRHRQLLNDTLTEWGYEVIATADGEAAWEVLQQKDGPQLALLDWLMPGLDGPQLCQRLRERTEAPYVYIILVTALGSKRDLIQGLQAGADDYLIKPYEPMELQARLNVGKRLINVQNQLLAAQEILRQQASRDSLTSVWNRGAILGVLDSEISRACRETRALGVLLADLDYFKRINDTCGHLAGDFVLQETTRRIQAILRPYDTLGRFGGEEFLVVLPGCDGETTRHIAERIRQRLAEEAIIYKNQHIFATVSLGGVSCPAVHGQVDDVGLLQAADFALYRAKNCGRNRVEITELPELPQVAR